MKRWYQLSMLQLLVAMAVVASLCWLNLRPAYSVEDLTDIVGLQIVEVRAGWPFAFRTSKAIVLTDPINLPPKDTGNPTYLWLPLLADIFVGLLTTAACVSVVGYRHTIKH